MLLRQAENKQSRSGRNRDLLFAVDQERNPRRPNGRAELQVPKRLARFAIERKEVAFLRAAKNKAASASHRQRLVCISKTVELSV